MAFEEIAQRYMHPNPLFRAIVMHGTLCVWFILRAQNWCGSSPASHESIRHFNLLYHLECTEDYQPQSPPKEKGTIFIQEAQKRVSELALAHRSWIIHDWRKIIFSDVKNQRLRLGWYRILYWSLSTSELQPHHVIPAVKHEVYNGRMNAEDYIRILDGDLTGTLNYHNLRNEDLIFQHDNDPRHTAKVTKKYLHEQKKYTVPS
ncbi:hypothetical protein BCV71DRAFT_269714 [Rhizopus microsporus]|uniref:Tc1-like transposase DDE domain-containing protein n=1 Tax=Rhizopus microsporus TaxID=58291 RepID=A0A1X0SGS8_RHIZD|nr:hypothetical protein BCV71DRAFT_269714 [Rhizopus microsporus]